MTYVLSAHTFPAHNYDMMYLLNAVRLTPGGSNTVHIYTQTTHRTTQQLWLEAFLGFELRVVTCMYYTMVLLLLGSVFTLLCRSYTKSTMVLLNLSATYTRKFVTFFF
jgi:hypothetical protein